MELVISGSNLFLQLWEVQRFSKAILLLGRFFKNFPLKAVACCNEALLHKDLSDKEHSACIYPLKEERLLQKRDFKIQSFEIIRCVQKKTGCDTWCHALFEVLGQGLDSTLKVSSSLVILWILLILCHFEYKLSSIQSIFKVF